MRKKAHIVSLFHFNKNIAGKDMFLVPMYLGKALNASVEFVYPYAEFNKEYIGEFRGVILTPIHSGSKYDCTIWSEKEMLLWLIKNAHRISILCLFWLNSRNIVFAKIYKLLNPMGICYIKGDMSSVESPVSNWKRKVIRNIKHNFCKSIDVFSVETENIYRKIQLGAQGNHLKQVTVLMSNGFDKEMFDDLGIQRRFFKQKENLIITVGRIGSKEKNNEMMISALDGLEMKDWKFILIGPIKEEFRALYKDFISCNPEKKENVVLMGEVADRRVLWEIYNKAKVFLLTSPKECMAQVFSEALAFGNYIITTTVEGAMEISDKGRLGKVIELNDIKALRQTLSDIFQGKINLEHNCIEAFKLSDTKYNWKVQTEVVSQRIQEILNEKYN